MSSKLLRTLRFLPLIAVLAAAALALPQLANAATYSMQWGRSVLLESPTSGSSLDSIACAPTVTTSATTTTTTTTTKATAASVLCVAGDTTGNVWVSEHPSHTTNASYWHKMKVDTKGVAITGVSCPTTTLCVAVDAAGNVLHSTDPIGGAGKWSKPVQIDKATLSGGGDVGLASISCPTIALCVAVDNSANGQVAWTTTPTGSATAWTLAPVAANTTLDSVACASDTLCVIAGSNRFLTAKPTSGASSWKAGGALTSSSSMISSLACITTKLCVSVGYGNAGTGLSSASSSLASSSPVWGTTALIGSNPPAQNTQLIDSVSCPHTNLCIAVDGASNLYTSTSPVRGVWSAAKALKKASQATASWISCSTAICIEVSNRGTATYGVVRTDAASTKTSTTATPTTTTPTTTKTTAKTTSTTTTG